MFKETSIVLDWLRFFSEVPTGIRMRSFILQLNVKYSLQYLDSLSCDYFSAGEEYIGKQSKTKKRLSVSPLTVWTQTIAPLQHRGSQMQEQQL